MRSNFNMNIFPTLTTIIDYNTRFSIDIYIRLKQFYRSLLGFINDLFVY